ncbi:hypothetical protein AIS58_24615, partial [Salmonella enterica]|nr:hypothetical protein [Salmonella enterica]ECH6564480.1 hypothetical protein [Salmonella enterica subsp. enterica serovar Dublin]EDB7941373.1 hypothetical protein [Salmonella enterica subsp. enterica serovar Dublin]EEF5656293.1 hypothetical protein [Salmonella enterica subsp. enterica serovar Dublin]EHH0054448.1 Flp pilus assembly complex ATPase component [Salmonella enterica subsp. enterica serovar Dublin]
MFSYESGQDSDDRNQGAEAWDFLKASSSGHAGNITTVHESSPESAVLGIVQRCYMNPECQNLPFNVI